jgi:hypothetical protein
MAPGRSAERTVRVWESIAAAHEGDGPVSVAAVCRAAVRCLAVDGASVTVMGGPVAREPLFASDELSVRLEELQFTTGEGPSVGDFRLGSPDLIAVQLNVSLEEASVRLRARAFGSGADLGELAGDVVSRRLRFDPDLEPESHSEPDPEPLA